MGDKKINDLLTDLKNSVDVLKTHVEDRNTELKNMANIGKIQTFHPLFINNVYVRLEEDRKCNVEIFMPVEIYEDFLEGNNDYLQDIGYKTHSRHRKIYFSIEQTNLSKLNKALEIFDLISSYDEESHSRNLKYNKDNIQLRASLFNLLEEVGIKDSYYDYKTSRSRNRSKINYKFKSEIGSQIKTSYSKNTLEDKVTDLKSEFNKIFKKILSDREKLEKEEREVKINEKELKYQALLLSKYDLDLECGWEDILENVLNRNKYLYLGHYLMLNRGDWSSGHDYASYGIDNFSIDGVLDQKIYDDITSFMYDNWDFDGRVFRDCEFNYSYLFDKVKDSDELLYEDYLFIYSKLNNY